MKRKKIFSKADIMLLKRSFKYSEHHKLQFLSLFLSIVLIIALGIIQPLLWGKIIQDLASEKYSEIFMSLIGVLCIYITDCIVTFIKGYSEAQLSNNIILDLKLDMFRKILELSMSTFDKIKIGEFISRLQGDVAALANIITDQAINIVINILKVVIIGTVIFKINTTLALIVLAVFPVTYLIFLTSGKKLRKESIEGKKLSDSYFSVVQQALLGIKHIKTYGIKSNVMRSFNIVSKDLKDKEVHISLIQFFYQTLTKLVSSLNDMLVLCISIYFISTGKLSIQYFVAFVAYSGQFSYSLTAITRLNSSIQQVLVSLERIFGLVDNLEFSSEVFGSEELDKVKGNIEFNNVSFSYNKETRILDDVSFSIKPNTLTAIVGRNGCGKTTILNLLLGLYKPEDGIISIDGINLKNLNEKSLRNNFSVVNQQNFLFNLSIRENLRLASINSTDAEIEEACKQVQIHEYIMSLDKKYDTVIEENGSNLSGGQKQRLALAMCILRNSQIILLDEATAALDAESKNIVNRVICNLSKSKTVIIITHNSSSIILADEIIIIDAGKKVGQGSHEELLKSNLYYKELYKNEFTKGDIVWRIQESG